MASPLPRRADGGSMKANGFRIMAEPGALPKQVSLRKEAEALRAELAHVAGPA